MLEPHEVFTPGRPPLDETNVYANRGKAEEDFEKALRWGQIPVVFGEFGVGKTSLVLHNLAQDVPESRLIYVESVSGRSMSDVLQRILEKVGYRIEKAATTELGRTTSAGVGAEVGGGFGSFKASLRADEGGQERRTESRHEELVVKMPSDATVLDIAEENGLHLVLDELHKSSPGFLTGLSDLVKAYSNKGCKRFKVVLVGTASDAARLVDIDPGIDRLILENHLRAMTADEATFVVEKGMSDLSITISDDLVARIVKASVGSPAIVQSLSLEIAESAFARKPRVVVSEDIDGALDNYVRLKSKRLLSQYAKAIETIGPKRYRKQILHAMAEIEDEYATMEQIRNGVSSQLEEDVDSTALSGPLRQLKTDEFGPVLKDVERHEGGERVYNYTTFVDPAMKSFIRVLRAGQEQGVLEE